MLWASLLCSAAPVPCSWAVHCLLGCYICHSFRHFYHTNAKLKMKQQNKTKPRASFHLLLFSAPAPLAWAARQSSPQPNFLNWLALKASAKLFPSSSILPKCFWECTFPPLPIIPLQSTLPLTNWSWKIKSNYGSLIFCHLSPRYWRQKELAPCLEHLAL